MEKIFTNKYSYLDYDPENIDFPVLDHKEHSSEKYILLKKKILEKWSEVALSKQKEEEVIEKEKNKKNKKHILDLKISNSLNTAFNRLIREKPFLKNLDTTPNCIMSFKEKKTSKSIDLLNFEKNIDKFLKLKYNLSLPKIKYVARGDENIICVFDDDFRFYSHLNILATFLNVTIRNLISFTYEDKTPKDISLKQVALMLHLSSYFCETILHSLTLILESLDKVMPKLIYNLEYPELGKKHIISNITMSDFSYNGTKFIPILTSPIITKVQIFACIDDVFYKIGNGKYGSKSLTNIGDDDMPHIKIFKKNTVSITDSLPPVSSIDHKILEDNKIQENVKCMYLINPINDETFDFCTRQIPFAPKIYLADYAKRTQDECKIDIN